MKGAETMSLEGFATPPHTQKMWLAEERTMPRSGGSGSATAVEAVADARRRPRSVVWRLHNDSPGGGQPNSGRRKRLLAGSQMAAELDPRLPPPPLTLDWPPL